MAAEHRIVSTAVKHTVNLEGDFMKKMLLVAATIALSQMSFAETTVLNCTVPSQTQAVKIELVLGDDQSVDFVTLNILQKSENSTFFSQMEKGQLKQQMSQGFVNFLALTEETAQVDGVIVKSGFLGLNLEQDGKFSGFLAAKGNVYPLLCEK